MLSIVFGLLAAIFWGGGDFAGGLASRKVGALAAVFCAEAFGLLLLLGALPVLREPMPALGALSMSFVGGAIGSFGLVLLYQAMVKGQMSIATPISALLAAALPIVASVFTEGMPGWIQLLGFAFGLASIWLVSKEDGAARTPARLADLTLPLLAGLCFGTYFVLIHHSTQESTLWPMIASRTGGTLLLLAVVLLRRAPVRAPRAAWTALACNAIFDIGGNLFYILAGQSGRMDVAAVISALYPAATVFLAWLILKERIGRSQAYGIVAALAAIALMTV